VIVCDDGSEDGSGPLAASLGACVLRLDPSRGPAAARNRGAHAAQGEILVFADADVRVHADTLSRLVSALDDPSVAAAFGSYDDAPAGPSWVSLYKNLAHHYVHQRSRDEASTFWAGCGAVRRQVFLDLGGFDEAYRRPSIEDVELGYRLRHAGHRIRLVREAQVTHLKTWTLSSWLLSDLRDRAIPWTRLLRGGRALPLDLNFTLPDRIALALVGAASLFVVLSPWQPALLVPGLACLLGSSVLDGGLVSFAAGKVSPGFGVAVAGFQLLHRLAALVGFAIGAVTATRTPSPRAVSA